MKKEKLQRKENKVNNSANKLKRYTLASPQASDWHKRKSSGGRFMNFRVILKYDDGLSRLIFTDKFGARSLVRKFKDLALFSDVGAKRICTDISVNLKHRPDVVIERLSRRDLRRAYFA